MSQSMAKKADGVAVSTAANAKLESFGTTESDHIQTPGMGDKGGSPTQKANIPAFIVFVVMGTAQLIGYNALLFAAADLNKLPDLSKLPATTFGEMYDLGLRSVYTLTLFISTALFIKYNIVKLKYLYSGLICIAVVVLGYPISLYASVGATKVMQHILSGALAIGAALVGSIAFGLASMFPMDYGGAVSAGLGVAGLSTFVIYIGARSALISNDVVTADTIRPVLWISMGTASFVCILACVASFWLFQKKWVKQHFAQRVKLSKSATTVVDEEAAMFTMPLEQKELQGQLKENIAEDDYLKGGIKGILGTTWKMGLTIFNVLFVTFIVFPSIGPFLWTSNVVQSLWILGMFQVGDIVGRYLPNVLPFLMVTRKWCYIISAARYLMFILAVVIVKFSNTAFFGMWLWLVHMLVFAVTNGWLNTVCFIRTIELVNGNEAKVRVASFCLLCLIGGIMVGTYASIGLKAIFKELVPIVV